MKPAGHVAPTPAAASAPGPAAASAPGPAPAPAASPAPDPTPASTGPAAAEPSAFAPLRHRVFAVLWTATVIGNVGLWMRDTSSGWLMTTLSPSATLVALVQAAATLPIFLLSLPAGALADILDRRRLLLAVQVALALVSLGLAIAVWSGTINPGLLLVATLLGGIGAALGNPAWQAVVPELVPRADLKSAVALNSLGINVSRAVGPALGGLVVATAGAAAAYLADVLTYVVVCAALLWWKRAAPRVAHPESFTGAMRAGVRYALRSGPLRRVVFRAAAFFLFASAYWALLPIVARESLRVGPAGYGWMLAAIGAGAIAGALLLPRLRRRLGVESLVTGGALATAGVMAGLAVLDAYPVVLALLALAGAAWIAVLTSLNATAQAVLPDWVRARGLAVYLTVFYGAMALGSGVWGGVADLASLQTSLLAAAVGGALVALAVVRARLPATEASVAPARYWEPAAVDATLQPGDGPALIAIEYRVPRARQAEFFAALEPLAATRRRDGAIRWDAFVDAAEPETVLEVFVTPSWAEHERQHERTVEADRPLHARVRAFHVGETPPRVRHFVVPAARVPPPFADGVAT